MCIGELAERAGISTSKLHFYEARGILPTVARFENGYRDYEDHALEWSGSPPARKVLASLCGM